MSAYSPPAVTRLQTAIAMTLFVLVLFLVTGLSNFVCAHPVRSDGMDNGPDLPVHQRDVRNAPPYRRPLYYAPRPPVRQYYAPRPFLRPLTAPYYPTTPQKTIQGLPFLQVVGGPASQAGTTVTTSPEHLEPEDATGPKTGNKLKVKSGLENSSEAEVEVLPVTLVLDLDVLATGMLDLLNTLAASGILPADEQMEIFKSTLVNAKQGEHQVFEVDPKSMKIILNEIMKAHVKEE